MKDAIGSNQVVTQNSLIDLLEGLQFLFERRINPAPRVHIDRQIINYKSIITLPGEVYLIECAFPPFLSSLYKKFFLHRSSIFRIWLREHKFLAVIRQRGMTYEYKSRYGDWRDWTVDRKVEEVLDIDWLWGLVVDLGYIFMGLCPYYIL